MAKAEWGAKRECPKCRERFYDLNNDPATCPNCANVFEIASLYQSDVRLSSASKEMHKEKLQPSDDILDDDVDLIDDDPSLDDELLEEDDNDTVSLDDLADVPASDEE